MSKAAARLSSGITSAAVLARSGVIRPYSPRTLARLGKTIKDWGTGPAGGFTSLAVRHPDRLGLIDDLGPLTFGEVHRRSNGLARSLRNRGVAAGSGELVAFLDADGTCDPKYFGELCYTLQQENAAIAVGSRMGPDSQMPRIRRLGKFVEVRERLRKRRVGFRPCRFSETVNQ